MLKDIDMPKQKACTKCGKIKPAGEFYIHGTNTTGLFGPCKECHKKAQRERYKNDKKIFDNLIKRGG